MASVPSSPFDEQSTQPVFSPEGRLAYVPTANLKAAVGQHGFKRAVPMVSPEGKQAYLPEDKLQDALTQNFKPALGGSSGGWQADQPKEPGILDTANEYYGAPAKPGEGLLHRLYRSAGRTAMIAPNLANALASPVTDPTTDEERQAHGVGGVTTAIINRLGLPITHLVDEPARAEAQKASAAYKQGHQVEAFGHELAGAIPFVGPAAASIGERMGSGDIAGGAADLGTMAALPKFIKEASPGGRLPGAPATGELALPATRAIADTTGKAVQAVRGTISPETMTAEQAATKAFRSRNSKANWQKEVQSSLPDARRAANNLGIDVNQMTLDDALKATSQAKKEVWGEYRDNFMEPNKEATVDTTPVAAKIRQTLSDRQIEQQPGRSNKVWSTADSYSNREMPLQEIEDRVRELNNETRAIEARYLTDKRAAKLSPANSAKFAERDGLRQLLLSKLDEMSGPGAAELRQRYGALNSLEDVVSRRIPVAQRAAPNSLPSVLAKAYAAGKVARGVFTFNPADILEGGVSLLSQRKSAMLNDPDYLTQLAFRKTQARPPATIRGQVVQPPPSPLTGIAGMLPRGVYEQPAGNPPPEPLQLEHMQPIEGEYVQPPLPPIKGLLKRGQWNVPPTGVEDMMPSQPQLPAKASAIPLPGIKEEPNANVRVPMEPNEPQRPVVPSVSEGQAEQLPSRVSGRTQSSDQPQRPAQSEVKPVAAESPEELPALSMGKTKVNPALEKDWARSEAYKPPEGASLNVKPVPSSFWKPDKPSYSLMNMRDSTRGGTATGSWDEIVARADKENQRMADGDRIMREARAKATGPGTDEYEKLRARVADLEAQKNPSTDQQTFRDGVAMENGRVGKDAHDYGRVTSGIANVLQSKWFEASRDNQYRKSVGGTPLYWELSDLFHNPLASMNPKMSVENIARAMDSVLPKDATKIDERGYKFKNSFDMGRPLSSMEKDLAKGGKFDQELATAESGAEKMRRKAEIVSALLGETENTKKAFAAADELEREASTLRARAQGRIAEAKESEAKTAQELKERPYALAKQIQPIESATWTVKKAWSSNRVKVGEKTPWISDGHSAINTDLVPRKAANMAGERKFVSAKVEKLMAQDPQNPGSLSAGNVQTVLNHATQKATTPGRVLGFLPAEALGGKELSKAYIENTVSHQAIPVNAQILKMVQDVLKPDSIKVGDSNTAIAFYKGKDLAAVVMPLRGSPEIDVPTARKIAGQNGAK